MKHKIAILTQPLGTNFGGILQNYALSKTLIDSGYTVETINRIEKNPNSKLKILISELKKYFLIYVLKKKVFTKSDKKEIYKKTFSFLNNHITLSKKITCTKSLKRYLIHNKFNAVIVGSDQTWRPKYSPNIYNYFLDFLTDRDDIIKVAYASSFGTSEWEFNDNEEYHCKELIKKFDYISVREKSGIDLCRKYLNVIPDWVLDPTILLSRDDYLEIAKIKNIPKRSGLFSYILDEDDKIKGMIEGIRSKLNLGSFTNQPKCRSKNAESNNIEDYIYPSVEGWILAFNDTEFIVTNSFHGTAFSIIFNKPFVTIVNEERGASRFYSLLEELGLESRIVLKDEKKEVLHEIIKTPIDYEQVNLKLEKLKSISLNFLLKSLEIDNKKKSER